MNLLLPLGLLGLLGIILLIIIYILKPKYQEKVLSSTFVWKLSLKYKKQRIPLEWLKSSLIFMLQLAVITVIALIMSNPNLSFQSTEGEKIYILDASASMLAEENGRTRFDRAKSEIGALAEGVTPANRVTVILAGNSASFVVRRTDDAINVKQALLMTTAGYSGSNIEAAMELAEIILNENPDAKISYFTSEDYKNPGDVEIINMSSDEWNVAVMDFKTELVGSYRTFVADVASYNNEAKEIAARLTVDGRTYTTVASIPENETVQVTFENAYASSYESAEIYIEVSDSFKYDNTFTIYGGSPVSMKVQIVSDGEVNSSTPYFLYAALSRKDEHFYADPVIEYDIDAAATEGYDIYIYDGITPETLPTDGAVWIFNPKGEVANTDIKVGAVKESSGDTFFRLTGTGSSTDAAKRLTASLTPSSIELKQYTEITGNLGFEVIMRAGNDPVMLTGNIDGVKVIVCAFDLGYSNLIYDLALMVLNFSHYSFTSTFDKFIYDAGTTVTLNKKVSAENVMIEYDNNESEYTDFPMQLELRAPGVCSIIQELKNDDIITESFFVRISKDESNFLKAGDTIMMPIITGNPVSEPPVTDFYSFVPYLAGLLLLLLFVEWVVQYREQY